MVVFVAVIAGLLLGSFLSVLIGRWPHWRGAGTGRSRCPVCEHDLAWYDLIPLVSWLMLSGRCRYCRAPIPAFYPVLELVMAASLGAYAYVVGLPTPWHLLEYAAVFALVSLFFFDLKHQMLPDAIVVPLGGVALARLWLVGSPAFGGAFIIACGLAALFGGLYGISRGRWLGFGDVKLAFVIGLLFGHPAAAGVTLIAVWAGALAGVALLLFRRASMQTALPFGSFWTAAALMTLLWPGPALSVGRLFFPALT